MAAAQTVTDVARKLPFETWCLIIFEILAGVAFAPVINPPAAVAVANAEFKGAKTVKGPFPFKAVKTADWSPYGPVGPLVTTLTNVDRFGFATAKFTIFGNFKTLSII